MTTILPPTVGAIDAAPHIPEQRHQPDERTGNLHDPATVEMAKQIRALIQQHREGAALAGDDTERLCRHKQAITALWAELAEVNKLLGKQERGEK